MAPDIDWELQDRGRAVLDAAASTFGEKRFASGQIQQAPRPTLHLYAVDPTQTEIMALDQIWGKAGYGLTVTSVRYSYAELLAFYERLTGESLPGDACVSNGFDAAANALRFTLRRLDSEGESANSSDGRSRILRESDLVSTSRRWVPNRGCPLGLNGGEGMACGEHRSWTYIYRVGHNTGRLCGLL